MAVFTDFSDLLPDPDNKINDAGVADANGNAGPGFAQVRFRSNNYDVQKSRTRSGRGVTSFPASHSWEFDISYNPLTRAEFEPVASFIESKFGGTIPFFVILPQYNQPRDATFLAYLQTPNTVTTASAGFAGDSTLLLTGTGGSGIQGDPKPGDYFTITDDSDVNHTKAYKVVRVETPTTYQSGLPVSAGQRRVHVTPQLVRNVSSGATLNFIDQKFKVQLRSPIVEYSLDTEGLYQFGLSLEEIQS